MTRLGRRCRRFGDGGRGRGRRLFFDGGNSNHFRSRRLAAPAGFVPPLHVPRQPFAILVELPLRIRFFHVRRWLVKALSIVWRQVCRVRSEVAGQIALLLLLLPWGPKVALAGVLANLIQGLAVLEGDRSPPQSLKA